MRKNKLKAGREKKGNGETEVTYLRVDKRFSHPASLKHSFN